MKRAAGPVPENPSRRRRRVLAAALALTLAACGGSNPSNPGTADLPAQPQALTPSNGAQVTTDTPTLSVQNARNFDAGQAQYTFEIATATGARAIASLTVPAGRGTTSATPGSPLPRGLVLSWRARATGAAGETVSATSTFRPPAVACDASGNAYAKAVVDHFLTECSRARNSYNDPSRVLGPPDAGQVSARPFVGFGFMSLGERGHVTVDMGVCAADGPGPDVRVYQTVSNEPVTLYAGGQPGGPFVLVENRRPCGTRAPGLLSGYCDFDLGAAEIQEARYLRIEDGELYPCEQADTDSEGADIDAVEILSRRP
jgi:hypothetical protein